MLLHETDSGAQRGGGIILCAHLILISAIYIFALLVFRMNEW